jgi:phenylpropionate dioxygenase-like ring-hydroxylating dioxygenase large terminal subunit
MAGSYYLRNQWYVAAHGFELADGKPIARTICDQTVVIFRGQDGGVGILSDRCPHRFAPLSCGEVNGNDIQCGYHGIRFDRDGVCTHIPGDAPVPHDFRARRFPALERHGFIWIWMGEKAADPALIPDYHENDDPGWAGVPGYLNIVCNYQLMVDNLLDLTHVVFVHKTTLAGGGVTDTPLEVRVEGEKVLAQRMMINVDTAPIYRAARGLNGKIDRWQIFECLPPSHVKITLGAREAGASTPLGEPVHMVLNGITPESNARTHYFWSTTRPWGLGDKKVDELYRSMIELAFNEDKAIVEAQQRLISQDPENAYSVNFPFDRAGQSARRIVRRLMTKEGSTDGKLAAAE